MQKSKPLVWIVDDELDFLEVYMEILGDHCEVKGYCSAEAAIGDYAAGARPELVLSDMQFPRCSGLDFVRDLRSQNYKNPIIFFSALDLRPSAAESLEYGIFSFLEKPFHSDSLLEKVKFALELDLSQPKILPNRK